MPKTYIVLRSVVPPGFDMDNYLKRSSEPIRYDVVTAVEADTPREAVEAVVGATGVVSGGFAAVECEIISFGDGSKRSFGRGGTLKANAGPLELESSDD